MLRKKLDLLGNVRQGGSLHLNNEWTPFVTKVSFFPRSGGAQVKGNSNVGLGELPQDLLTFMSDRYRNLKKK